MANKKTAKKKPQIKGVEIKVNEQSVKVIQDMFAETICVAKVALDTLEEKLKKDKKNYEVYKPWLVSIRGIIENTSIDFMAEQDYGMMSHAYNLCTLVSSLFNGVNDMKYDEDFYNKVMKLFKSILDRGKEVNDAVTEEYIEELKERAKGSVTIFEEKNEPEKKSFIFETVNLFDVYVKKAKKACPVKASFYESKDTTVLTEECDAYGVALHLRQKVNCELLDGCACFIDEDEINGKPYVSKFLVQNHVAVPKSLKSNKRKIKSYLKGILEDWKYEILTEFLQNCIHSEKAEDIILEAADAALAHLAEYVADTRKMK